MLIYFLYFYICNLSYLSILLLCYNKLKVLFLVGRDYNDLSLLSSERVVCGFRLVDTYIYVTVNVDVWMYVMRLM